MNLYIDCTNGVSGDMLVAALEGLGADLSEIHALKFNPSGAIAPPPRHGSPERGAGERSETEGLGEAHDHGHDEHHEGHDHDHEGHHHHEHEHEGHHHHEHEHEGHHHHEHEHRHGRSFVEIRELIGSLPIEYETKKTALNIYTEIAKAEAKVHGATLETVHFHEVGREEAIRNVLSVAESVRQIAGGDFSTRPAGSVEMTESETGSVEMTEGKTGSAENTTAPVISSGGEAGVEKSLKIFCSELHDGNGQIECAHGLLDVPVPAVRAIMEECEGYSFITEDGESEMITPSGLAMIKGLGAVCIPLLSDFSHEILSRKRIAEAEGRGTRAKEGRPGLKVYLVEG